MPCRTLLRLAATLCLGVTLGACASALPRYADVDPAQALTILRERADHVRTLSAACRIILERPDGRSIQLVGALAARAPDHLRIRGWKASQAVLDLTLRPDGLWLYCAQGSGAADEPVVDQLTAARVAEAWSLVTGGFRSKSWALGGDSAPATLRLVRRDGRTNVVCDVARSTLTVRRCEVIDDDSGARMTLMLDRYRRFGDVVWPARVRSASPRGTVTVLVDDPVFNQSPPPKAFDPPRRAVRLP
jgi:hypothetical protein